MRRDRAGWVLGFLIGMMVLGAGVGTVEAGEPPSDRMLEKHGLKRVGPLFVLEAESGVLDKADEVRGLSRQLAHAVAQQRATLSEKEYQDTIKELNNELNQLRAQSNAANQTLNRLPKFRTRRGTYFANNYVTEEAQELTMYRNQLQMEISQRTTFLNQLKGKRFDPKDRIRADNDVRKCQELLHAGAQEMRKAVDEVRGKYAEVEKDPQVKKWLETPEGHAAVKPRLGPSRAFLQGEKMLERIERESGDGPPDATAHKASRRGRHSTRSKRSSATGGAESPF